MSLCCSVAVAARCCAFPLTPPTPSHPHIPLPTQGFDWQGLYPFPAAVLPAIRYNPQSFQVLDLLPDGSWEWADAPKNRGGGRCSDWWSYAGQARFEASVQPNDGGERGLQGGRLSDNPGRGKCSVV